MQLRSSPPLPPQFPREDHVKHRQAFLSDNIPLESNIKTSTCRTLVRKLTFPSKGTQKSLLNYSLLLVKADSPFQVANA